MRTGSGASPSASSQMLSPAELRASRIFIDRVLRFVPAELIQASLFGSRARGQGRPDSDVDILLVFRRLAPDREPHATMAERLAEEVAVETRVPVTVWSVALIDLEHGNRTPMLVDALEDGIPLWCAAGPLPAVRYTPDDARRCVGALQQRIREGSQEFAAHLAVGRADEAFRRARDDVIRACTAVMLTRGVTRPRRGGAAAWYLEHGSPRRITPESHAILRWAVDSYGPHGRDEEAPVPPAPGGLRAVSHVIDLLRTEAAWRARGLTNGGRGEPRPASGIPHRE
jgi:hypothetical protein